MSGGLSLSDFVSFVRAAELAVLATSSPQGKPEAALMGIAVTDKGELIVDMPADARKLANIEHNDQAAMVIGWDAGVSIQVEGRIRVVTGEERTGYERVYSARFPGSRVGDPAFVVAVLAPEWVRRYDATTGPARCDHADWLTGA